MTDINTTADPASLQALLAELPANLLAGRRVLVTGAARGLGLAFAKCIAKAGASVVLADILADLAQAEAQALRDAGFTAHALAVDLCDPASIDAVRRRSSRAARRPRRPGQQRRHHQLGRPRCACARRSTSGTA